MDKETVIEKISDVMGTDLVSAEYILKVYGGPDGLYQKLQRYEALRDAMELI